jgi:hypothetical protein
VGFGRIFSENSSQIFPNFPKFSQIFPNFPKFSQIFPNQKAGATLRVCRRNKRLPNRLRSYLVHFQGKKMDSKTVTVIETVNIVWRPFWFMLLSKVSESLLEVVISPCINHEGWGRMNACARDPVEKNGSLNWPHVIKLT